MKVKSHAKLLRTRQSFCLIAVVSLLASLAVVNRVYLRGVQDRAEKTLAHWDQRAAKLKESSVFQDSKKEPVPIGICPDAVARSNFAIVTMLTAPKRGDNRVYQVSAAKLAVSIRTWSPNMDVDLIMLLAVAEKQMASIDRELLTKSGWTLCHVRVIPSPHVEHSNRFLDSGMFSRLLLWKLLEYKAVLSLDSDMVISQDISKVFSQYYPLMKQNGMSLGAARDGLSYPCVNPSLSEVTFNAGMLLLVPNTTTYEILRKKVNEGDYDLNWAEQGLLNSVYQHGTYLELPFLYNAHIAEKKCNASRWNEIKENIVVFHYTVVKGWSLKLPDIFEIINTGETSFNIFGAFQWDMLHLCYIWELIPEIFTPGPALVRE
jgi:hypothetical protein